ncbi:MAG: ABC transporter permease [Bacteroidetes bacterium]|nr:ABC transporter permease [Bacteroidota bacterium]
MIKSYIKIAIRNFTRNITFSLINLFGLSIAFALFILLSLYIRSELTTDKHIENVENIYCLYEKNKNHISTAGMFAEYVNGRYPEIKQVCRNFKYDGEFFLKDGSFVYFDRFITVDSNYFEIFRNKAILGNLEHALDGKNGMVLTETAAKALFGDKNPIGKTVNWNNNYDFVVNAVIPDVPENSSYHADCYVSILCLLVIDKAKLISPGDWTITTFVEVNENVDITKLEKKLSTDLLEQFKQNTNWGLLPYLDIYFNQQKVNTYGFRHGNKQFVLLFIWIALFILVIACINYINLTTAKTGSRAREVGIRKVVGAYKQKLIKQFLAESILLILFSLVIGFLLAEFTINEFNRLAEINLHVKTFYEYPYNIVFILGAIILGIISGLYPAFVLTSFKTVEVIKGKVNKSKGGVIARKALMVFQFIISLIMIVGTIVIYRQINYVKQINLGFNKEHVIHLKTNDAAYKNAQDFKNELLAILGVEKVSFCAGIPGDVTNGIYDEIDGQEIYMKHLSCDDEYLDLMGMELVSGRNFSGVDASDIRKTYMVNEAAVKAFGLENPYEVKFFGFLKLIGIVKDFNFQSLHQPIAPLFITFLDNMEEIVIRISGTNQTAIIDQIEKAWIKKYPKDPFSFKFVDQVVDQQYKSEERLGKIVGYFSIFALIIACMGLLGMTSYMIQQRHREIGIRKVHGGSVQQIINMLSFEFVKWVILAFLLSVPVSYYLMKTWLAKNFTYQVEVEWWIFIVSGIIVVVISLLTVILQSYRAAVMNPVDSLRYE